MTGSGIRSIVFVISEVVEKVSVSTNEVESDTVYAYKFLQDFIFANFANQQEFAKMIMK